MIFEKQTVGKLGQISKHFWYLFFLGNRQVFSSFQKYIFIFKSLCFFENENFFKISKSAISLHPSVGVICDVYNGKFWARPAISCQNMAIINISSPPPPSTPPPVPANENCGSVSHIDNYSLLTNILPTCSKDSVTGMFVFRWLHRATAV